MSSRSGSQLACWASSTLSKEIAVAVWSQAPASEPIRGVYSLVEVAILSDWLLAQRVGVTKNRK